MESTLNYKQFKLLKNNRKLDRKHVNRLVDAIKENPEILKVQPILVNEKFEVIDGQHRFTAAKELGLPIHYTVVEHLDIDTARKMNTVQKNWNWADFAHSYAQAGNVNYKAYLKFKEEHPSIASTVVVYVMAGAHTGELASDFKKGDFVMSRESEDVEYILNKLEEIREITGNAIPISRALVAAICLSLDKHEDFDMETIIANLKRKPELLQRTTIVKEAFRVLEDIHNYNKGTNQIRLY